MNVVSVKLPAPGAISHETIPGRFERIAALHGSRLAIGGGGWEPTYGELNAAANRLAYALIRRGGAPGDRVAMLMGHDAPTFAATFAVLKAGRVLVALNPADPPARLRQLLLDAEAGTIVTDAANHERALAAAAGAAVLRWEDGGGAADNPVPERSSSDPAFIVYTSGSTGQPNGLLHSHSTGIGNADAAARMMKLDATDRILLLAAAGGGQATNVALMALLTGASVWPFLAAERGVGGLADFLTEREITTCTWSASLFRHLVLTIDVGRHFPAVRCVRIASEQATKQDFLAFQRHFTDRSFLTYTLASTEAGHIARTILRVTDTVGDGPLPIGIPHDGVAVEILDDEGRAVPRGEAGELVVTSPTVALGYWRNPELTAERFSARPDRGGMRTLRTRDLVRWNVNGVLEFVGRKATRVKIRGHTVDLFEVETVLRATTGVNGGAAILYERPGVEPQIVAFVIPQSGRETAEPAFRKSLKGALQGMLPRHMVPSAFLFLDAFPLSAGGKLDRGRLREMFEAARERHIPERPSTATEDLLARIWADVLDVPIIGRHDDFFEWGGDSLNASVVSARVQAAIGVRLDLRMFFDNPTLAGLASVVDDVRTDRESMASPTRAPRGAPLPASFEQERIWAYTPTPKATTGYVTVRFHRLIGPLDVALLRQCMDELVRRHEILRTALNVVDGRLVQVVRASQPAALRVVDLPAGANVAPTVDGLFQDEMQLPFDLTRGPLSRSTLLRVHADEHWLMHAVHHVVSDGWSANLYYEELSRLYEAGRRGLPPPAPNVEPLQYSDYACWQRQTFGKNAPAFRRDLAFWRSRFPIWTPDLKLPFARKKRRADAVPADGMIRFAIRPEVSRRINALARARSVTPYVVRLAAFAALMSAETGRSRLYIGGYFTGRGVLAWQDMHGVFANLVTLCISCAPGLAFDDFLTAVRNEVGEAGAHSGLPYEMMVKELRRRLVLRPRIKAIFSTTPRRSQFAAGDIEFIGEPQPSMRRMPWGFSLALDEVTEGLACSASFDARLYDPVAVRAFIDRYLRLLEHVTSQPAGTVRDVVAATQN